MLPMTSEVEKRDKEKEAIRKQGFSDNTTTDEEDSEEKSREAEDEREESLMLRKSTPNKLADLPVALQQGHRHRGLRLQLQRWSSLRKNTTVVLARLPSSKLTALLPIHSRNYGPPDVPRRFQHQGRRSLLLGAHLV